LTREKAHVHEVILPGHAQQIIRARSGAIKFPAQEEKKIILGHQRLKVMALVITWLVLFLKKRGGKMLYVKKINSDGWHIL
jgi:hypothetical protein